MQKFISLKELFNGIKMLIIKIILYTLTCKKSYICFTIKFGGLITNISLVCLMMINHSMYLITFIISRSYKRIKNLIEITNEWFYFALVILLIYFNTVERWNGIIESLHFWIILAKKLNYYCITLFPVSFSKLTF